MKCAGYWCHLLINDFRFGVEVMITSLTEMSDSDGESVVLHHLFPPVRDMQAHGCESLQSIENLSDLLRLFGCNREVCQNFGEATLHSRTKIRIGFACL